MIAHTFVIPAYGESPYLIQCIQHLQRQTVPVEIIITTSTPSVYIEEIAAAYHLPYFINTGDKGIGADWNFAVSQASTPLVTIAHQDDIYEPGYSEAVIKKVEKHGVDKVQIVFTGYRDIVNGKIRRFGMNALVKNTLLLPFKLSSSIGRRMIKKMVLLFGDPICCPSVTLNKTVTGDIKFDNNYQCALDWLAWYQLSKQEGSFVYINKKLVQHRIHIDSETTNQINNGRRRQEEQQLFELMLGKRFANFMMRFYAAGHKDNL